MIGEEHDVEAALMRQLRRPQVVVPVAEPAPRGARCGPGSSGGPGAVDGYAEEESPTLGGGRLHGRLRNANGGSVGRAAVGLRAGLRIGQPEPVADGRLVVVARIGAFGLQDRHHLIDETLQILVQ